MSTEVCLIKNKYWPVFWGTCLVLIVCRQLLSSTMRAEDYQELVFLFVFILFYFFQKYLKVGISRNVFIALFIFWGLLQARVFLMRELGYYNGKVLISKLAGDNEGYKARAISRGIKIIARTYHLSGPSLIPYDLEGRDIERWFSIERRPAIIISGSTDTTNIELPISNLFSQIISEEKLGAGKAKDIWLEKDSMNIKIPLYSFPINLPLPPSQISLEGESSNVMNHYIGWLSGYFHPDLSKSSLVRQDTIHEVAKIDSPWKNFEPRALARYLKSMEEVFEMYPYFGDSQVEVIQSRLSKVLIGLRKGDLYCSILSVKAFLFLEKGDEKSAKKIYKTILRDRGFSARQKQIAAKNLGTIELE